MARIPMSPSVAGLIGNSAEKVENRSLLLEKFSFHKDWGLDGLRANDAHRWSLMRIATGGAAEIRREAERRGADAERPNVDAEKADRLREEARLAGALARTAPATSDLAELRARHTRRFLGLFQSTCKDRSRALVGKLEGRLAINLADSLMRNAGIALDRLFGLPYVPGSAVKGVTRAIALEELSTAIGSDRERLFDLFRRVFGTADNDFKPKRELAAFRDRLGDRPANFRGAVAFLPAYPIDEAKVVVDLTNVHFPTYYQGDRKKEIAPGLPSSLATESPQPNPFPCVEAGARFAFCLVATGADKAPLLLESAERWLAHALTVRGLGAKTAAGYGWFSIEPKEVIAALLAEDSRLREAEAQVAKRTAEAVATAAADAARKAALKPEDRIKEDLMRLPDQDFAGKVLGLATLSTDEQRAILLALNAPAKRDRWKKWKKSDKDTDRKRVAVALEASKTLGIPLP